ncbi:MAG: hypothetical protein E7293_05705 [Lachnospiraceae bacterium]|nr:hypothetical protein [Lachnospiraceae bacterium]
MKEYSVKRISEKTLPIYSPVWDEIQEVQIDTFPWKGYYEGIRTKVKAVHSDYGITVHFETDERPLAAHMRADNEEVCCDSCVEFFLRPEDEERYINLEINPLRVIYCGFGTRDMRARVKLQIEKEKFLVSSLIQEGKWVLQLTVPYDFWRQFFGEVPGVIRGNFYKCGDETGHEHYACWSPVQWEFPRFHLPEYFGKLILE